jgi:hypothetical protein
VRTADEWCSGFLPVFLISWCGVFGLSTAGHPSDLRPAIVTRAARRLCASAAPATYFVSDASCNDTKLRSTQRSRQYGCALRRQRPPTDAKTAYVPRGRRRSLPTGRRWPSPRSQKRRLNGAGQMVQRVSRLFPSGHCRSVGGCRRPSPPHSPPRTSLHLFAPLRYSNPPPRCVHRSSPRRKDIVLLCPFWVRRGPLVARRH